MSVNGVWSPPPSPRHVRPDPVDDEPEISLELIDGVVMIAAIIVAGIACAYFSAPEQE